MRILVSYPQVIINNVEIDIPDNVEIKELSFDEKFDLVEKYWNDDLPSYDKPEYRLCKESDDADYINFDLSKIATAEEHDILNNIHT